MKQRLHVFVAALAVVAVTATGVYAAQTSKLSQTISAGTITMDNVTSGGVSTSPTFNMNGATVSTSQQTVTGTYGDATTGRIQVDNPGAAKTWNVALAATNPTVAWTTDGTTLKYKHNGATAAEGQLSLTSAGTVTPVSGDVVTVSGPTTPATFTGTTPITIMSASTGANHVWKGYITGIGLSQTIPASMPAGTYHIDMTQTLTSS
ncbi:MAG: hypothetical protein WAU02_01380 [Candidatus Saccharimonadales bacterium]